MTGPEHSKLRDYWRASRSSAAGNWASSPSRPSPTRRCTRLSRSPQLPHWPPRAWTRGHGGMLPGRSSLVVPPSGRRAPARTSSPRAAASISIRPQRPDARGSSWPARLGPVNGKRDLAGQPGFGPVRAAGIPGRHRRAERAGIALERAQLPHQVREHRLGEPGADVPRVPQPVIVIDTQQQRADRVSAAALTLATQTPGTAPIPPARRPPAAPPAPGPAARPPPPPVQQRPRPGTPGRAAVLGH